MSKYPTQINGPSCGAYAAAYYLWHRKGEAEIPEAGGRDFVNEIYSKVKFGIDAPVVEDTPDDPLVNFSDPVKIINYLTGFEPVFYYEEGIITGLLSAMIRKGGESAKTIESWRDKRILNKAPPLDKGYLISLCYQITPEDPPSTDFANLINPSRVHYALINLNSVPPQMINSWDGSEKDLSPAFLNGKEAIESGPKRPDGSGDQLVYLKAGILLP
jgi:hypothetical protein